MPLKRPQLIAPTPKSTPLSVIKNDPAEATYVCLHTVANSSDHFLQLCDKISYPSVVSVIGNASMALAFILIGPLPSLALQPSFGLITGSVVLVGFGYANVMVSTFSRAQGAAIRSGFERDIDTYLLISGQLHQ